MFSDAAAGFRKISNNTIDICDNSKSKFYTNVGGSHIISTKKSNLVSEPKKLLICPFIFEMIDASDAFLKKFFFDHFFSFLSQFKFC